MLDVTEQGRIASELRRREERLNAATLGGEVGVWTWTPETDSVNVGANWRGLFGQALEWFDSFHPDVLLVDLAMPEIDGYMLLDRIRASHGQKGATIPAVALTAYAREEDEHRALASGFRRHVAKPVDSHSLVRTVAQVHVR
jgi:CheY-like chemotaxis protein